MRANGNLKVRGHRGRRSFFLTWRSGSCRRTVLLGSERQGLTERSAGIAAGLILAWPTPPPPRLVAAVVVWVAGVERRPSDG